VRTSRQLPDSSYLSQVIYTILSAVPRDSALAARSSSSVNVTMHARREGPRIHLVAVAVAAVRVAGRDSYQEPAVNMNTRSLLLLFAERPQHFDEPTPYHSAGVSRPVLTARRACMLIATDEH